MMSLTVRPAITTVLASLSILTIEAAPWDRKVEYFKNVNLTCMTSDTSSDVIEAWLLPSGNILHPSADSVRGDHFKFYNNGSVLEIHKIDDPDFGIYFCIYKQSNGTVGVFKAGVNINGPYYGEEMMNGYKRKAVIGGIAAGVVLILIVIGCLLCSACKRCGKSDIEQSLVDDKISFNDNDGRTDVVENGLVSSAEGVVEGENVTKIGDTVYDTADVIERGIIPSSGGKEKNDYLAFKGQDESHADIDHYISIGSLERDLKPPYGGDSEGMVPKPDTDEDKSNAKTYPQNDDNTQRSDSTTVDRNDGVSNIEPNSESEEVEKDTSDTSDVQKDIDTDAEDIWSDTSINSNNATDIYAKPLKAHKKRSTDKTEVSIIQGEIIIESCGMVVPVTSAQSHDAFTNNEKSPVMSKRSLMDDNFFGVKDKNNSPAISERVIKDNQVFEVKGENKSMINNSIEMFSITQTSNAGDHCETGEKSSTVNNALNNGSGSNEEQGSLTQSSNEDLQNTNDTTNKCDQASTGNGTGKDDEEVQSETTDKLEKTEDESKKKKMSSVSSTCSDVSKSTVDDETIARFENVLASLVTSQRKSSGSSLSNVSDLPEDSHNSNRSVEDVHL